MEWFLIGLVLALVLGWNHRRNKANETRDAAGKDAKQCPHCAEWVKAEAKICRYCQRELPPAVTIEARAPPPLRPWREVFGVADPATAVLGVLFLSVAGLLLVGLIWG